MREAVIDANVLVYEAFEDSPYHGDAAGLLDELDRWLIPMIVICEYVWFLGAYPLIPGWRARRCWST